MLLSHGVDDAINASTSGLCPYARGDPTGEFLLRQGDAAVECRVVRQA